MTVCIHPFHFICLLLTLQSLVKRSPKSTEEGRTGSPVLGEEISLTESRRKKRRKRRRRSKKCDTEGRKGTDSKKAQEGRSSRSSSLFPSSFISKLAKQIEPYKEILQEYIVSE